MPTREGSFHCPVSQIVWLRSNRATDSFPTVYTLHGQNIDLTVEVGIKYKGKGMKSVFGEISY